MQEKFKIALLIDGENASPKMLEAIVEEVSKNGSITIRRIYGDWTQQIMNGWKEAINANAIQPIQQFTYTQGKNSSDSALIIDAMDILNDKVVNGFCIVSSDSDYTRLATRIREDGLLVIGVGEEKTPKAFVKSCDLFVHVENLVPAEAETTTTKASRKNVKKVDNKTLNLLKRAYEMAEQDNGEPAHITQVVQSLRKIEPDFDPRTYGFKTFPKFLSSLPQFEVTKDGLKISIK
jgi:uncharacterized LabA/DUF88 family protein